MFLVPSQRYQDSRHLFQNPKVHQSVMGFSNRAQRFTTPYYLDVGSPFQPVHNNSTSSLGQTSASHFASTIALVLANLGPLVLASSLMRSRAPSFMKSRASESEETRAHRSCVYRQCILVINLRGRVQDRLLSSTETSKYRILNDSCSFDERDTW